MFINKQLIAFYINIQSCETYVTTSQTNSSFDLVMCNPAFKLVSVPNACKHSLILCQYPTSLVTFVSLNLQSTHTTTESANHTY